MGTAFNTAWKLRQQAAYFGAASFAETVSVWTAQADPAADTPVSTEAVMVRRGEQMQVGDIDRSVEIGAAIVNKHDVTLLRAAGNHWGYIQDAGAIRYAITKILRENAAFYHVELERIECDRTSSAARERLK